MLEDISFNTYEFEADLCSLMANEHYQKAISAEILTEVKITFEEDVAKEFQPRIKELVLEFVKKTKTLPMYGSEFVIENLIGGEPIPFYVSYVYPPSTKRYGFELLLEFEIKIEAEDKDDEEDGEDDIINIPPL
jgi:hypothetical protein